MKTELRGQLLHTGVALFQSTGLARQLGRRSV